ncbi:MAG TPA: aminoacyl-tRNA hydrolase [Sedimentisphaerales bacterium]|nr:aminoacyl-tRNA hydrolase [Sedimentisphaerales bacterium]HRS11406.1 aminoacyl-tRNA hydrolase [Sedimentisphaerales bacterium]HRV48056.1 aminoacyl-tRNA hydrolase [Sedimentisphaerales bacterium]
MADLKLVVGLGNPGPEYAETRHNLGFKVIEALDEALGIAVAQQKFGARVGEGWYRERKVMLMKPWQFMNHSGQAVATAVGFYQLGLEDLMVITDDKALAPGRIRIRPRGSAGGHNGLADIIARLGSDAFARCRIGIGDCPGAASVDYVLGRPKPEERPLLNEAIVRARDAVLCWLESGIDRAMNEFNSPPA